MLILTPLSMVACATWAVIPDMPRLLGLTDLYLRLANDPRIDLFFWHYTIDRIEQYDARFNLLFAVMLLTLQAVAWRELRLREKGL